MPNFHLDKSVPSDGVIFVFGSNLAGRHGAGAALAAILKYGAVYWEGDGHHGQSYAIPTKDQNIARMTLDQIRPYVERFVAYANAHPSEKFFVTRIGCGLAGNDDRDIAPMFKGCGDNCSFANEWRRYLT